MDWAVASAVREAAVQSKLTLSLVAANKRNSAHVVKVCASPNKTNVEENCPESPLVTNS